MVSEGELGTAGMADVRGKGFDYRKGRRFFASPKRPPRSGAHPSLLLNWKGWLFSPRGLSDRSVKLTTGLCLVPTLRISVAACLVAVVSWSPHCFVTCNVTENAAESSDVAKLHCLVRTVQTKLPSSSCLRLKV